MISLSFNQIELVLFRYDSWTMSQAKPSEEVWKRLKSKTRTRTLEAPNGVLSGPFTKYYPSSANTPIAEIIMRNQKVVCCFEAGN